MVKSELEIGAFLQQDGKRYADGSGMQDAELTYDPVCT